MVEVVAKAPQPGCPNRSDGRTRAAARGASGGMAGRPPPEADATMRRGWMEKQDHIYKIIEIAGSSETSIDDAIQRAVARAAQTLKHLRWFEVIQTRGHIENGKVHHYQVTVKVGFTLEDSEPD